MYEVAHGGDAATRRALVFIVCSSLAAAAGSYLFPVRFGPVLYRPTFFEMAWHVVFAVFAVFFSLGLMSVFAHRFFKARVSFESFFRVVGHGYAVGLLYLFPFFSLLIFGWILLMVWRVLHTVFDLDLWEALWCVLATALVWGLLIAGVQGLTPGHLFGGLYLLPTF